MRCCHIYMKIHRAVQTNEQKQLARRSVTDRTIGAFAGMARQMYQHQRAGRKRKMVDIRMPGGGHDLFNYAGTPKAEEQHRIDKALETQGPEQVRKLLPEIFCLIPGS